MSSTYRQYGPAYHYGPGTYRDREPAADPECLVVVPHRPHREEAAPILPVIWARGSWAGMVNEAMGGGLWYGMVYYISMRRRGIEEMAAVRAGAPPRRGAWAVVHTYLSGPADSETQGGGRGGGGVVVKFGAWSNLKGLGPMVEVGCLYWASRHTHLAHVDAAAYPSLGGQGRCYWARQPDRHTLLM